MFKLNPIEDTIKKEYISRFLPGLIKRIKNGVTINGHKNELSEEAKLILIPDLGTDHEDYKLLNTLLTGNPEEIKTLSDRLMSDFNNLGDKAPDKKVIENVFHYEYAITSSYKKEDAYWLAKKIGRNTCTYCNRQYVFTVEKSLENGKIEYLARPEFDHWFDKATFPLLSLSLHNLIPSCKICNSSAKGKKTMELGKHVHPYIPDPEEQDFTFRASKTISEHPAWTVKIERAEGSRIDKTITVFHLDEIYGMHSSLEVRDIMTFHESYPKGYLKDILNGKLLF